MSFLLEAWRAGHRPHKPWWQRGPADHEPARQRERLVRWRVLACARWAERYHQLRPEQIARLLDLTVRTLYEWRAEWKSRHLQPEPRGRRPEQLDHWDRHLLLILFGLVGPVGVPTLQALLPSAPRRALEHFVRTYRHGVDCLGKATVHALQWHRPGSVWAMDFTAPPQPIDASYKKILTVRDLSSGKLLGALPVAEESAQAVIDLLKSLFLEYGPPLVLKSDNGSSFTAQLTTEFVAAWNVHTLFSPPYTPEFNGAAEAGIGALKTRAHFQAARNNRPGQWTCDDVEAARLQANQTARPRGANGPTPDESWDQRRPLTPDDRLRFSGAVEHFRTQVLQDENLPSWPDLSPQVKNSVDRITLTRVLLSRGYLNITRRPFPPMIPAEKCANNP